ARRGEDRDTYYRHLNSVADTHPSLTMDDGCDLVSLLHQDRAEQVKEVLAGYGWVGKGIAARMKGHGGHVAVVEVEPIRALEALMDGFEVKTAAEAASWADLLITATGN